MKFLSFFPFLSLCIKYRNSHNSTRRFFWFQPMKRSAIYVGSYCMTARTHYSLPKPTKACKVFRKHAPKGETITLFMWDKFHKKFRDDYRNENAIKRDIKRKQETDKHSLSCSPAKTRSTAEKPFDYKRDCLLCGQPATFDSRKDDSYEVFPIRTFECERSLLHKCAERGDRWGQLVQNRIQSVNDLHAADAVYHQQCNVNFRTHNNIPTKRMTLTGQPAPRKGRPVSEAQTAAFLKVARCLQDNDDEQITLTDL